jgi:hypothetical protein
VFKKAQSDILGDMFKTDLSSAGLSQILDLLFLSERFSSLMMIYLPGSRQAVQ